MEKFTAQPERQVYLITGKLKNAENNQGFTVNVWNSPTTLERIESAANQTNTNFEFAMAKETSGWVQLLTSMIPFIILIFFIFFC